MHGNDVTLPDLVQRHLDLDAVPHQPDEPRLLAEGIQQHLARVVLGALDQQAAEGQAPAHDRARQNLQGGEATDHHQGVKHVDAQPAFLEEHFPGPLEARDGGVGEQSGRHRHQRREGKLRRRRHRQRHAADGEVQIQLVQRFLLLGTGQGAVDDLDDAGPVKPPGIVIDLYRATQGMRLVAVDAEHAHQLAFDGVAQAALAVEHGILEPDRPGTAGHHLPAGHQMPVAMVANHAMTVAGRDQRRHHRLRRRLTAGNRFGGSMFLRRLLQAVRQPRQHLARGMAAGIVVQVDPVPAGSWQGQPAQFAGPENAPQEALQIGRRLVTEQLPAVEAEDAGMRQADGDLGGSRRSNGIGHRGLDSHGDSGRHGKGKAGDPLRQRQRHPRRKGSGATTGRGGRAQHRAHGPGVVSSVADGVCLASLSASMAARPPSMKPSTIGFSWGIERATNTVA